MNYINQILQLFRTLSKYIVLNYDFNKFHWSKTYLPSLTQTVFLSLFLFQVSYFWSFPVNIEMNISYVHQLEVPKVTICNSNQVTPMIPSLHSTFPYYLGGNKPWILSNGHQGLPLENMSNVRMPLLDPLKLYLPTKTIHISEVYEVEKVMLHPTSSCM